jgi:hypothetical protein
MEVEVALKVERYPKGDVTPETNRPHPWDRLNRLTEVH